MQESKKKVISAAGLVLRLIGIFVASYVLYIVFLSFYPYTVNGPTNVDRLVEKATANHDIKACGKIRTYPFPLFIQGFDETTDGLKNLCYFLLARSLKDESICNHIDLPNDMYKNSCISEIAYSKKDITICEKVTNQVGINQKGDCYQAFTRIGTDMSVCDNIRLTDGTENLVKDLCYYGAVEFNPDMEICANKIQTELWKVRCYQQIARSTKNPALCDILPGHYESYERELNNCKEYIETR
jgi:hypothetical protein